MENKLKKLTWKYFWRFKIIEVGGVGILIIIILLSSIYSTQIADFWTKYKELIGMVVGGIVAVIMLGVFFMIWVRINWSMAEEKAQKKLRFEK